MDNKTVLLVALLFTSFLVNYSYAYCQGCPNADAEYIVYSNCECLPNQFFDGEYCVDTCPDVSFGLQSVIGNALQRLVQYDWEQIHLPKDFAVLFSALQLGYAELVRILPELLPGVSVLVGDFFGQCNGNWLCFLKDLFNQNLRSVVINLGLTIWNGLKKIFFAIISGNLRDRNLCGIRLHKCPIIKSVVNIYEFIIGIDWSNLATLQRVSIPLLIQKVQEFFGISSQY